MKLQGILALRWLCGWIKKDKDFLAQKIGKAWKFKYSELEVWIKNKIKIRIAL